MSFQSIPFFHAAYPKVPFKHVLLGVFAPRKSYKYHLLRSFHSLAPRAGMSGLFAWLDPQAPAPCCTNKSVLYKDTFIGQAVPRSILGVLENSVRSAAPGSVPIAVVDT